jgi:DNA-binding CsgD family transcriptional regulator
MVREKQVHELFNQGKSINQILEIIYFDLPKSVVKYAIANIKSHIQKLKEDGLI